MADDGGEGGGGVLSEAALGREWHTGCHATTAPNVGAHVVQVIGGEGAGVVRYGPTAHYARRHHLGITRTGTFFAGATIIGVQRQSAGL